MSGTPASPSQTIRSTSGIVFAAIGGAVGVFLLGDAAVRGAWDVVAGFAPWVLLVMWAIYLVFSASYIRLDADAVAVQNLLRRHRIPWANVTDVYMKYQLMIETAERSIACWGGPSAGRPPKPGKTGASLPPSLRVKETVVREWEARRGEPGATGATVSTWDWPMVAVGGVLAVWALLTLVF